MSQEIVEATQTEDFLFMSMLSISPYLNRFGRFLRLRAVHALQLGCTYSSLYLPLRIVSH